MIKLFILIITILFQSTPALSKYEIKYTGNNNIEMRDKYNYDYSNKYRGSIDNGGYVRMRNYNGEVIRGNIGSDGYGRLRDQDGNTYRVKPH